MTLPKPQPPIEAPEAPAIVTPLHVQDRVLRGAAGAKLGWSKLSPFEKAHRMGKLMDKEKCKTKDAIEQEAVVAVNRYQAGDRFAECWKLATVSWPSGSDLNRVRVVGTPGSFCDHQLDAKAFLRHLEAHMGRRDWMMVRRVCGEDWDIAPAVIDLSPSYRDSTLARFREALDVLVEAQEIFRLRRGFVNMERG